MNAPKVLLAFVLASPLAGVAGAQTDITGVPITGTIDLIDIRDVEDVWSSGRIGVAGQLVIVPRNLVIDLPANRLTLQQLFAQAPPAALANRETGLSTSDVSTFGQGATATILANRSADGNLIAGDIFIEKRPEVMKGTVTFVSTRDGYFRMNGRPNDDNTGVMVRINDPGGRFTIQGGRGCDGGPNCSPDPRFGVDPDNYTVTFSTGYPACIPSRVTIGNRPGYQPTDGAPGLASDAQGVGDPFCPFSNRTTNPVPDSTRFAPIRVGDTATAEGSFEYVAGTRFLAAHTVFVDDALTTQDSPTQPDYMIFDEVEWDIAGFQNQRQRVLFIGFTTLADSLLDVYSLQFDPTTNETHEFPLASTFNNPQFTNQGIGAGGVGVGHIFKIRFDVDFVQGVTKPELSPCLTLQAAGFNVCPGGATLAEEFDILNPVTRDLQGRTRHSQTLNPGVVTRDINGNEGTNGQYLNPVGLGHAEFVEISLGAPLATPFIFAGIPWNLDRRLGPGGCDGPCEGTAQRLEPFPFSGLDPRTQAPIPAGAGNKLLSFFPFNGQLLDWPPPAPPAIPIQPTPLPTWLQ